MYKLLLAAFYSYSMLLAEGASLEKRQNGNLPMDCSALVLEVNVTTTSCPSLIVFESLVDAIVNPASPEWNTRQNREWLNDVLDDFCTTDCLNYTVEYYSQNCSGPNEDLINLYQNYYCASRDTSGQYCLLETMNYLAETTAYLDLVLQCTRTSRRDESCSPVCMEVLEGFQNELGCCTANVFNTTGGELALLESYFENCDISLMPADMCSGARESTAVSLLLLIVSLSLPYFSFII